MVWVEAIVAHHVAIDEVVYPLLRVRVEPLGQAVCQFAGAPAAIMFVENALIALSKLTCAVEPVFKNAMAWISNCA